MTAIPGNIVLCLNSIISYFTVPEITSHIKTREPFGNSWGCIGVFFQIIEALGQVRNYLFRGLAIAAIVFGALNIRDFIRYKPGGVGTEMPIMMRPRVKKILNKITSTRGAAVAGIIVTVFLLPCTVGPYIIAAGILSVFDMIETAPVLLLYNLVFVLPFLGIMGGVYLGMGRVHDVYVWKEKNIGKLHLIAGCIILGLGIFMLLGIF